MRLPLVSPLDRALFLKVQPYLEGLPSSVLVVLASYTEERFYPMGASIRLPDAPLDRIIFLGSGAVEIGDSSGSSGRGRLIESPGAIGLAHHFAETKRPPGVRAVVDTLCLEIATVDLRQILEDHFPLVLQMARTSCEYAVLTIKALAADRPAESGFDTAGDCETPVQMDLVHRLARAKRAPFLRGINLTVLGELFRMNAPRLIARDEALWKEGEPLDEIALVLDGAFETRGRFGLCRAPSGATLGAWEIYSEATRFESWVAVESSRVLCVRKDLLTDLLEDHFEFAQAYLRRVSRKLVDGWDAIENLRERETPI